jgi:tight adherence protein B
MTVAVVTALVVLAVLAWPGPPSLSAMPTLPADPRAPDQVHGLWMDGGAAAPSSSVRTRVIALVRRLRPPDRADALAAEAAYCEMLALALRAGLSPTAALEIADPGQRLPAVHPDGLPGASQPQRGGRLLALAWAQSEELGTPLADAVATCAAARQADHGHELRRRSASAGPRASMQLLTALPVLGPGLATLVGLGPDLADPVVVGMLLAGFGATTLGWWWARRLVARADLPVRVARAPSP